MHLHINFTNQHTTSSTSYSNTSCYGSRRFIYYITLYLFVITVVITAGAAVIPVFVFKSDIVTAIPNSIYIPGAGFAGFWYHFGYFTYQHQIGYGTFPRSNHSQGNNIHYNYGQNHNNNSNSNTYYCYSSGCLGYVLAAASVPVETVLNAAQRVQKLWLQGHIHRYDVVPIFLQEVLPAAYTPVSQFMPQNRTVFRSPPSTAYWDSIISQLRIIVTVMESKDILKNQLMRHRVHTPTSYFSLIEHLQQTTHIPWLTGPITTTNRTDEIIIDGGFSRILHPVCSTQITVPATWSTMIHSLNPGLDPKDAKELFYHGMTDANQRISPMESSTLDNINYEIFTR